uniref:Uncharacterized protein n=1 Tax=Meloidogyne hapla TaxID=6305 RepID=A0A1I8AXM8_MELHA
MLGVILLSPQNEIIHAFGNAQFKLHFFNVPQGKQSAKPSSSSGISSPTSCCHYSSASSVTTTFITTNEKKQENNFQNNNESEILEEEENENNKMNFINNHQQEQLFFDTNGENLLLCQLLPLVAICRANENQNKQKLLKKIQFIQSSSTSVNDCNLQVHIAHLEFSYMLIMIFNDQNLILESPERLFASLLRCINFHYGPQQFPLLSMNTSFVRQLRKRCEFRINKLLNENIEENNIFNKNFSLSSDKKEINSELIPALKELTKNVAQKFGSGDVCCILICSDRYIASSSISNNNLINNNEFGTIIKFIRQPLPKEEDDENDEINISTNLLKYQSEHSFILINQKQFLFNIFNISLNEKIELILLIPSGNYL